jgi:hypothetical protein
MRTNLRPVARACILCNRIGIIEAKIGFATEFLSQSKIETN